MNEHRFTDETATVIVLNQLVRDMHHVLGRIVSALTLLWVYWLASAFVHGAQRDWPRAGLDLVGAAGFWLWARETRRRQQRYHVPTGDERGAQR